MFIQSKQFLNFLSHLKIPIFVCFVNLCFCLEGMGNLTAIFSIIQFLDKLVFLWYLDVHLEKDNLSRVMIPKHHLLVFSQSKKNMCFMLKFVSPVLFSTLSRDFIFCFVFTVMVFKYYFPENFSSIWVFILIGNISLLLSRVYGSHVLYIHL